jgi:hypothetical protein
MQVDVGHLRYSPHICFVTVEKIIQDNQRQVRTLHFPKPSAAIRLGLSVSSAHLKAPIIGRTGYFGAGKVRLTQL